MKTTPVPSTPAPEIPSGLTRRAALARVGVLLGGALTGTTGLGAARAAEPAPVPAGGNFVFCLNTATIRGQKLGLAKEIEVASEAGYQAIEPWVSSIEEYQKAGGKLPELRQRLGDRGLVVASAIGFPEWIVDDDTRRAAGLEQAKRDMDRVAQLGGRRIAAPPAGATEVAGLDLHRAAERYRALLELGDQMGVRPMLELWGFSKCLNRLSEVAFVAIEAGHPQACVLADVYHLYKGGTAPVSLRLLSGTALPVFHVNDYPAEPPRDKITDGHRIYPGDGVAPLSQLLRDVQRCGGPTVLSLELFNREYYQQDALSVARTGLAKMKAAAAKAAIEAN
jgi:2-keto-myo-inositol isomerase